jgi:flagellar basal body-associated protein FliL
LGVCALGIMQWKNLNFKTKELEISQKVVSKYFQKWDAQTKRTFVQTDLKLNVNAIPLEVVVANLSQNDNTLYVSVYPVIKFVNGNLSKEDFEKVLPKIRETFLEVINQKNSQEILKDDGISSLKEDLIKALNQLNLPLEVEKIYFSNFSVS